MSSRALGFVSLMAVACSSSGSAGGLDDGGAGASGTSGSGGADGSVVDGDSGEDAASPICASAGDCYPGVVAGTLLGEAQCLDSVEGAYCTHTCTQDSDCCAVVNECSTAFKQVCAPFESSGLNLCFLSCELADTGGMDETQFCQQHAGPDFSCRSVGGGAQNRKVCLPL